MEDKYERILINMCKKASKKNEVPVSALIVDKVGNIIAKAYNTREKSNIIYEHAEIKCISKANKRLKSKYLTDCALYVTLEPCDMCKILIKESRINIVRYIIPRNPLKKAYNKTIFENWNCSKKGEQTYRNLLSNFFKKRRY